MRDSFPDGLVKYAETPIFTEVTVPDKLTALHDTKPAVWGRLVVIDGKLDYVVPGPPERRTRLEAGQFGVIRPAERHRVEIVGPVSFKVEFLRSAETA